MNKTLEFQTQIEKSMNLYFSSIIGRKIGEDDEDIRAVYEEYNKQYEHVITSGMYTTRYMKKGDYSAILLSAISEPTTNYTLNDVYSIEVDAYNDNLENKIYSPRIDLAFSPIIKKSKGKNISIGIFNLTPDVSLFDMLHRLDFVKRIERRLRFISNQNLSSVGFMPCTLGLEEYHILERYINRRPLHLIGIEIENQKNAKHLMGDFLNVISLSRIPVVVVPEANFKNTIDMIRYCYTIQTIKGVKEIYNLLKKVNILKVSQLRNLVNELLAEENLPLIPDNNYS